MLPIKPEPKPTKARELLDKVGSALFDDDDPVEQGLIPPRHRDKETPRERYVRDMETRWAEFHQAENDEGDALLGVFFRVVMGAVSLGLWAIGRWVLHLSYASQWKLFAGPALIYVTWMFWSRNREAKQTDE